MKSGICITKSMMNWTKIKQVIKTPVFCFFLIFVIIALVFTMHQIKIFDLKHDINELVAVHDYSVSTLHSLHSENSEDIAELQEEIDRLKSENAMQSLTLEEQSEMLLNYEQHVTDLKNELNAYELALEEVAPKIELPTTWEGPILTKEIGGNMGPAGRETYYNLNMNGCINKMRELGYSEEEYPYWVRDDGAKMLGRYVMIAANWKIRPLGTILETSLGWSIVVDTGEFVADYPYGVDIAVDW